eukprot:PLAT6972.1.p1 GENE.PLAT6972.1~~PLAT6972.1.p1  ORF type:complete len:546 (+),score=191.48 PLAT6972.1:307-1944(+)
MTLRKQVLPKLNRPDVPRLPATPLARRGALRSATASSESSLLSRSKAVTSASSLPGTPTRAPLLLVRRSLARERREGLLSSAHSSAIGGRCYKRQSTFSPMAAPAPSSIAEILAAAASGSDSKVDDDGDLARGWVSDVMATPLSLTVSEPRKEGYSFKPYVTYLVCTSPLGYMVRRRFSDFEWLRQVLAARYVGILIPPLPGKRGAFFGGQGAEFIRQRQLGLCFFLRRLVANPYIKTDVSFMDFLSIQDGDEWSAAKKNATASSRDRTNLGEIRWREAITAYDLPDSAERLVMDVKRQLESSEKVLKDLVAAAKRLKEKSAAFAAEMNEFKIAFGALGKVEAAHGDSSRCEFPNRSYPAMEELMTSGVDVLSDVVETMEHLPMAMELLLHERLKYELLQIGAMRDMLKARDDVMEKQSKAVRELERAEVEHQAMLDRGRADRAVKAEAAVNEGKRKVQRLQYVVDFQTKGFFFLEFDRFNAERVTALREMFGVLAAAYAGYCTRMLKSWVSFATTGSSDPSALVDSAKGILADAATVEEGFETD